MAGAADLLSALGTAGELGSGVSAFAGALGGATAAMAPYVASIEAATKELVNLGPQVLAAVTPFVKAFDPALVERLNFALENLNAAIGTFLTPVIEAGRAIAIELNAAF